MTENEIATIVVDSALHIHKRLGPGLLEFVYQTILAHELTKRGLHVEKEVPIPLKWDNLVFDVGFRADLVVNGSFLIELKSIDEIADVHKKQLLTYLKISEIRLGLLLNFGQAMLKDGIVRIANGLPEEKSQ
jgi:GxxExxY protein